jgi:hypothetical protein
MPKKVVNYPGYPKMGSEVTVEYDPIQRIGTGDLLKHTGVVVLHRYSNKTHGWFVLKPATPDGCICFHVTDIVK